MKLIKIIDKIIDKIIELNTLKILIKIIFYQKIHFYKICFYFFLFSKCIHNTT